MEKFKAKVKVSLKPTIKDIKAMTLEQAVSHLLPVKNLSCKVGSFYTLEFEADNKAEAEKIITVISEEILSNSVIEEYETAWE